MKEPMEPRDWDTAALKEYGDWERAGRWRRDPGKGTDAEKGKEDKKKEGGKGQRS